MGRYFEHLTEEEEKEISKLLIEKYDGMSLFELEERLAQANAYQGLRDHVELEMLTSEIRYVDPQPADYDGKKLGMLDDEAGMMDSHTVKHLWNVKSNKFKQMENAGKSTVQETEATALLNRLCHLDDVAHGNKHTSQDVKVRLFGLEPEPEPNKVEAEPILESWFAIVNGKLDSLRKALRETSDNLERINSGTHF